MILLIYPLVVYVDKVQSVISSVALDTAVDRILLYMPQHGPLYLYAEYYDVSLHIIRHYGSMMIKQNQLMRIIFILLFIIRNQYRF